MPLRLHVLGSGRHRSCRVAGKEVRAAAVGVDYRVLVSLVALARSAGHTRSCVSGPARLIHAHVVCVGKCRERSSVGMAILCWLRFYRCLASE